MGAENEGGSWSIPSFRLISLQNTGNSNQLCCWETKMTICTCVYNYLCQKVVLGRIRVFVYWSSDAPSLTLGHLPRVTGRSELSPQCRVAAIRWAEEFGQELKWTSRGDYGLMVNMCWSPPWGGGVCAVGEDTHPETYQDILKRHVSALECIPPGDRVVWSLLPLWLQSR